MDETSKTLRLRGEGLRPFLVGSGIDIGCGPDPVMPDCRRFDRSDGDAELIDEYVDTQFDYVWSSHCLEHMSDPVDALSRWWGLVRPGGHLVLIVPDEDLYEQGFWPSRFNADHKATFRLRGRSPWSPVSISLEEQASALGGSVRLLEVHDDGIDRRLLSAGPGDPGRFSRTWWTLVTVMLSVVGVRGGMRHLAARRRGKVIDQTALEDDRLAQICLVLQKPPV